MRRPSIALLCFFPLLLTACQETIRPPIATPIATSYILVTPDANATATPTPFQPVREPPPTATRTLSPLTPTVPSSPAPPQAARPRYLLDVALDYAAHSLAVRETIEYPNLSEETLDRLMLAVEPNRWSGSFSLTSMTLNGQPATTYTLQGGWLEVSLSAPLPPGETVTLTLEYTLNMPWAGSRQVFGYNNQQLNAVDWYPFVLPYAPGHGWLKYEPTSVGEHLVYDVADFEVTIRPVGTETNLVIAASAPLEGDRYRLHAARNFAFAASPLFLSKSTVVSGVTITSYYLESERAGGEALLDALAGAVSTYSERFAPYPYSSLAVVETPCLDGLEHCGLFFLSRRFYADYDGGVLNNLIAIGVHEAAHNWWYCLVGNDQAMEPWLDEALAIYSEYIFYSDNYPAQANGWWDFRVNAFHPTGWVDANIYNGGEFRPYTNAVYLQGARFLQALRWRMGDEAFFAFLKAYAAQMAYRRVSAAGFFALARQYSTADFSDLIRAYFQNPP